MKDTFKRYFYLLQDFFPSRLPVGLTAYEAWVDRLYFTYFPKGEQPPARESQQFSIGAMILHLDFQSAYKPNRFFGRAIRKGASNEVASYVMQELKRKQEESIKAAREAEALRIKLATTQTQTQAEATAPQAQVETRQ